MFDSDSEATIHSITFKNNAARFIGNVIKANNELIVSYIIDKFKTFSCLMSVNVDFMFNHFFQKT